MISGFPRNMGAMMVESEANGKKGEGLHARAGAAVMQS